jgi:AraC family L-rhamnose operon transcriptional activator RhaR/AraC family L-rhamnose operon regulatory protein RhaS
MEYIQLSNFTEDTDFSFFIQLGKHEYYMPIHYHVDFSELVIVLSGTADHLVNSEKYLIKKGDVFVINKNTFHGYENAHDFKICNIMYKPKDLILSAKDLKELKGYNALFIIEPTLAREVEFKSRLQLSLSEFDEIKELILDMVEEYENKNKGYKTIVYSSFMRLIVLLSRKYDFNDNIFNENLITMVSVINYIENNFKEEISLKVLAEKAGLSMRHFNRIFKEHYNTSPINYLIRVRIQHACIVLKKNNYKISEIAYECGFLDSNYFTRQFKKVMGISPKEYRNKINSNER